MSAATTEEERESVRRALNTAITRAENVVGLMRASFKTDDYPMVLEMALHLEQDAENVRDWTRRIHGEAS